LYGTPRSSSCSSNSRNCHADRTKMATDTGAALLLLVADWLFTMAAMRLATRAASAVPSKTPCTTTAAPARCGRCFSQTSAATANVPQSPVARMSACCAAARMSAGSLATDPITSPDARSSATLRRDDTRLEVASAAGSKARARLALAKAWAGPPGPTWGGGFATRPWFLAMRLWAARSSGGCNRYVWPSWSTTAP
jgi:hypothetical protein